ncbi:MAG: alpha/beta hydrolase [Myxococcales bacterium FL481]|nr:MAG: alpha/beta hydrolase [Myxococcales bacterium FL481]
MRRILGRTFASVSLLLAIAGIGLWGFFARHEAPILQGQVEFGVPYHGDQTLDVYLPTIRVDGPRPVLLFLHGGGWVTGSKETVNINRFNRAIGRLRDAGFAVVSPNYTLARNGRSPFPDCIHDVFAAVEWIRVHASRYRFDLDNLGILGESAGGQLGLLAAYAAPARFALDHPRVEVRYVIGVYPPTDLARLYRAENVVRVRQMVAELPGSLHERLDLARALFGFDPNEQPTRAQDILSRYSPREYASADAPPTLLIHGTVDSIVPFGQSERLHQELTRVGADNQLRSLPGVGHAFSGATPEQRAAVQTWVVDWALNHGSPDAAATR